MLSSQTLSTPSTTASTTLSVVSVITSGTATIPTTIIYITPIPAIGNPTTSSTQPSGTSPVTRSSKHTGAIVGGAVGGAIVILALLFGGVKWYLHHQDEKELDHFLEQEDGFGDKGAGYHGFEGGGASTAGATGGNIGQAGYSGNGNTWGGNGQGHMQGYHQNPSQTQQAAPNHSGSQQGYNAQSHSSAQGANTQQFQGPQQGTQPSGSNGGQALGQGQGQVQGAQPGIQQTQPNYGPTYQPTAPNSGVVPGAGPPPLNTGVFNPAAQYVAELTVYSGGREVSGGRMERMRETITGAYVYGSVGAGHIPPRSPLRPKSPQNFDVWGATTYSFRGSQLQVSIIVPNNCSHCRY